MSRKAGLTQAARAASQSMASRPSALTAAPSRTTFAAFSLPSSPAIFVAFMTRTSPAFSFTLSMQSSG